MFLPELPAGRCQRDVQVFQRSNSLVLPAFSPSPLSQFVLVADIPLVFPFRFPNPAQCQVFGCSVLPPVLQDSQYLQDTQAHAFLDPSSLSSPESFVPVPDRLRRSALSLILSSRLPDSAQPEVFQR